MKNLKVIMIVLAIFISITICMIIIFNNKNQQESVSEYEKKTNIELKEGLNLVENKREFFAISNKINSYLQEDDENIIKKLVYNKYLSEKEKENENNNDIKNNLSQGEQYSTEKIYYIKKTFDFSIYYVCGLKTKMEENVRKEEPIYHIFLLDNKNMVFAVIPIGKLEETSDIEKKLLEYSEDKIEKNEYNSIQFTEISDENMCRRYITDYISNMIYNPNKAYETLNKEYRNKRFGNIENYKLYINENEEIIKKIALSKYKVSNKEGYNEYIIIDNYNNYYIFRETAIMQYSIIGDVHTIDFDEFTQKYNSADKVQKVGMNIEKIMDALNTKDYNYLYGKLADSYKKNNFPTLERFIEYAKNMFSGVNSVEFLENDTEGENYLFKVLFKDSYGESMIKIEKTIIMRLKENNDFIFSFNLDNDELIDINPD